MEQDLGAAQVGYDLWLGCGWHFWMQLLTKEISFNVDVFLYRIYYERRLLYRCLYLWEETHLRSRIEWKLMIRAEYHDRYEIWSNCNVKDFAEFNSYCRPSRRLYSPSPMRDKKLEKTSQFSVVASLLHVIYWFP